MVRLPSSSGTPKNAVRGGCPAGVLMLSGSLALVSFGYGSLTSFSALYADWLHVTPRPSDGRSWQAAQVIGDTGRIHRYSIGPAETSPFTTSGGAMVLLPNYDAIIAILNQAIFGD